MTSTDTKPFESVDAGDKIYKPLILKWLSQKFGYNDYPHSYKDQWINWSVWDRTLNISFDNRVEEQAKLVSMIPVQLKGVAQINTLKIVNTSTLYINLKSIVHLDYPKIKSSKLISKQHHKDNDGDSFYTYDWCVSLSDGTEIIYHNQEDRMDMEWRGFIYDATIQQREFLKFLQTF